MHILGLTLECAMRSILKKSNFFCLFFFLLLSFSVFADKHNHLSAEVTAWGKLKFHYKGYSVAVDKRLKKEMQFAEELIVINSRPFDVKGKSYVWLIAKVTSKPKAFGKGYCGAGTEDYLVLASLKKNLIQYHDKFKVQSCMDGFRLDPEPESSQKISDVISFKDGGIVLNIWKVASSNDPSIAIITNTEYKFSVSSEKIATNILSEKITNSKFE